MENTGKTVVGGLSGAALLAFLLGVSSSKPSSSAPQPKPADIVASMPQTMPHESVTLDDSGPWVAVCQEYWTSAGLEPAPVTWSTDPPEAEPGATELTTHGKERDDKVPVLTYPQDPHLEKCKTPDEKVSTIIATAPDPLASHLQLDFDRSITAFQRAATFMGYDFQRYWFPWSAAGVGSDKAGKSADLDQIRLRLQQPGVMIFRRTAKKPSQPDERLAIFIVGETPTQGVNRQQFDNALLYAAQLRAPDSSNNDVDIAGPQFSASLRGMADVLISQRQVGRRPLYRVYSPSASSDSLLNAFSSRLREQNIAHDLVTFEATYRSSLKLMRQLLVSYGYEDSDIAVLVEDQSAFGSAVVKTDRTKVEDQTRASNNLGQEDGNSDENLSEILTLQFPRDLSAIRNAEDAQPLPAQQSGVPSLGVPLSLRETGADGLDSPPAFAREQSAAALDRELQEIVRTVRADQIQVVVLAVSNPLDRVYLFDYLHRAVPDVRLATLDSDVFTLGRPRYVDLRGTIGVTALPLSNTTEVIVRPRLAEDPHKVHVEFSSTPQTGAYLSVLSLLTDPSTRLPTPRPYTPNNCASVSFVGKNGFLPGKLRHVAEQGCVLPNRSGIARVEIGVPLIPWPWTAFSSLLLFMAGYYIYWCRRNALTGHPEVATGWLPRLVAVRGDSKHRLEKLLMLLNISNQLLLLEWLVVTATFGAAFAVAESRDTLSFRQLWDYFKLLQLLNLVLHPGIFVMSLALTVRLTMRLVREYMSRPRDESTRDWPKLFWVNFPISLVYVALTAIAWWRVLGAQRWDLDQLVALRSIDLAGGLSPLAMMAAILLAYTLWSYSQLQRITMMESREVLLYFRPPKTNLEPDPVLTPFETLHDKFRAEVDYASRMKPPIAPLLFALIACSLLRLNIALRGIDGNGLRYWSMFFGVGMLVVVLSISFQQMWAVWRSLRNILKFLNETPVGETFSRLPKEISSMRIWRIGVGHQSLAIQRRTLMELKKVACAPVTVLAKTAGGQAEELTMQTPKAKETETRLNQSLEILQRIEKGDCSVTDNEVQTVRESLNMKLPSTISLLRQNTEDPLASQPLGSYLAYRFLALIQYGLMQIRTMMLLQMFGLACLVICISMYPFQGRQALSMLLTLMFFVLLLILGRLFFEMEGNPILRRLEQPEGESKESGVSFLRVAGRLITVGGVPLLAVLTSQFPSLADFFSTWLSPVSEALK